MEIRLLFSVYLITALLALSECLVLAEDPGVDMQMPDPVASFSSAVEALGLDQDQASENSNSDLENDSDPSASRTTMSDSSNSSNPTPATPTISTGFNCIESRGESRCLRARNEAQFVSDLSKITNGNVTDAQRTWYRGYSCMSYSSSWNAEFGHNTDGCLPPFLESSFWSEFFQTSASESQKVCTLPQSAFDANPFRCCGKCLMTWSGVKVVYWPQPDSSLDCSSDVIRYDLVSQTLALGAGAAPALNGSDLLTIPLDLGAIRPPPVLPFRPEFTEMEIPSLPESTDMEIDANGLSDPGPIIGTSGIINPTGGVINPTGGVVTSTRPGVSSNPFSELDNFKRRETIMLDGFSGKYNGHRPSISFLALRQESEDPTSSFDGTTTIGTNTYISPSIYLEISTVSAADRCAMNHGLGSFRTSFPPGSLSTVIPNDVSCWADYFYNVWADQKSTLDGCTFSTESFDFAHLPCPPKSLRARYNNEFIYNPEYPYGPMIEPLSGLLTLLQTISAYPEPLDCGIAIGWDPPSALNAVGNLVRPTLHFSGEVQSPTATPGPGLPDGSVPAPVTNHPPQATQAEIQPEPTGPAIPHPGDRGFFPGSLSITPGAIFTLSKTVFSMANDGQWMPVGPSAFDSTASDQRIGRDNDTIAVGTASSKRRVVPLLLALVAMSFCLLL